MYTGMSVLSGPPSDVVVRGIALHKVIFVQYTLFTGCYFSYGICYVQLMLDTGGCVMTFIKVCWNMKLCHSVALVHSIVQPLGFFYSIA